MHRGVARAELGLSHDDAVQLRAVLSRVDDEAHALAKVEVIGKVEVQPHAVLGHVGGHALVGRLGAITVHGAHHDRLGANHMHDLAIAVAPVDEEERHDQVVGIAEEPEEQDHESDRACGGEQPADAHDANGRESQKNEERSHGLPVDRALLVGTRLVGHLERGERDAQRLLDDGDEQVWHNARLVDAAPGGGDGVARHDAQADALRQVHGQPVHQKVEPAAGEDGQAEHRKQQRRADVDKVLDGGVPICLGAPVADALPEGEPRAREEMELARRHDDAAAPTRALLDVLLEGVGRAAARKGFGQAEAHEARGLDEQAGRKVLGDGFGVEATHRFERLTRDDGVGSAVDDAV